MSLSSFVRSKNDPLLPYSTVSEAEFGSVDVVDQEHLKTWEVVEMEVVVVVVVVVAGFPGGEGLVAFLESVGQVDVVVELAALRGRSLWFSEEY